MNLSRVCRIASTLWVPAALLALFAAPAAGTPYDVNKYWDSIPAGLDPGDTSDSLMCWAATGANVLTYTGWGIDDTTSGDPYAREYDVYHEFLANYPNQRGNGTNAYNSYFDWNYPGSTATIVQLYPDTAAPGDFLTEMFNLKDQGYGLYLSINMGHAITMWDYTQMTPVGGGSSAYFITVSDSDDAVNGTQLYQIMESGGYWRLQDFYGSDNWYIRRVDALRPRFMQIDLDRVYLDHLQLLSLNPQSQWTQVAQPTHTLYRYSPLGADLELYEGPYSLVTIPEPSISMLVLTGLATLAGATGRRKAK